MSLISNLLQKSPHAESSSPSDQFTSLEWIEATRDSALQLWRTSVMSMSESMPAAPKQICDPHRRSLKQLVDEMPTKLAPTQIDQRRLRTTEILKSYGSQMGTYIDSQDQEARAVLTAVAQITESLSGVDNRYAVRLQGITKKLKLLATCDDLAEIRARLNTEVTQLERCLQEQQRDTRSAMSRLSDDVSGSEQRKQRSLPGPASQHGSNVLLALDRAIQDWDHYCLVRYDFRDRGGSAPDPSSWSDHETVLQQAIPESVGYPLRAVVPKPGVFLAAVQCQLLAYAGQAESIESALGRLSGLTCVSRVVEPLKDEAMREAMVRLEKAG